MEQKQSHFPILILLIESGYEMVAATPADIPSGEAFRVIETNYNIIIGKEK